MKRQKQKKRTVKRILAAMAACCAASCDAAGELTFGAEQISEAVPAGFVAKRCAENPDDGADAYLRLSILTSFDAPMTPGKRYAALGEPLEPGKNFTAEDIVFGNSWFFLTDAGGRDISCESAADCANGGEAAAGVVCVTPEEMGLSDYYYAPGRVCALPARIEAAGTPRFTHYANDLLPGNGNVLSQNANGRSFAFMLDNSATLDGSQDTGIPTADDATDPYQYRKVGLNAFHAGLNLTAGSDERFEFAAIFANGSAAAGVYDMTPAWLRTEALWTNKVMQAYPTPSGLSPIWTAATAAIDKITQTATPTYRKSLIAFTDGLPDDGEAQAAWMSKMTAAGISGVDLHWIDFRPGHEADASLSYAKSVALGCGNYFLIDSAPQIPQIMQAIAANSQSHWDIGVKFSAIPPEGALARLATTIVVKLGESAVVFDAQRQTGSSGLTGETTDNRFVFVP